MSKSHAGVWPCNFCSFWSDKKTEIEKHEERNHADRTHETMKPHYHRHLAEPIVEQKESNNEQTTAGS